MATVKERYKQNSMQPALLLGVNNFLQIFKHDGSDVMLLIDKIPLQRLYEPF
jgi:hypothetical protein